MCGSGIVEYGIMRNGGRCHCVALMYHIMGMVDGEDTRNRVDVELKMVDVVLTFVLHHCPPPSSMIGATLGVALSIGIMLRSEH